jgi:F-box interacting protein
MSDVWDGGIPADVFEDILLRIPPCPRQRLRLVCRHWRDAIDERAPEPRASSETKVLAFFTDQADRSRAYVFDDLAAGRSRELDLDSSSVDSSDADDGAAIVGMIGTCNGLLCLRRKRGDIVVTNPIIGETVVVELPPEWYCCDESFRFGYLPATGQYKIVHRKVSGPDAMCVLTLGEGSWRVVRIPHGFGCYLLYGFVSIDGITYWATANCERIVSFDLKDERVAPFELPPAPVPVLVPSRELTDVGGRLGLVVSYFGSEDKTDVWVQEGGGDHEVERAWVKRCTVLAHGAYPHQKIAMPHVAHGGRVLTAHVSRNKLVLGAHQPQPEREMPSCGMVQVGPPRRDTTVGVYQGSRSMSVFAYVETREPVLVYGDSPRM